MHLLIASIAATALSGAAGDEPAADLRPVSVAVVDRGSGKPVTQFSYKFSYKAPGRRGPRRGEWTAVESASGEFVVPAPASCELWLTVKGRDHVGGSTMDRDFVVRSTDPDRRVVMELTPGITVRGTVRDFATKQPIAGARVSPIAPGGMLITIEEEWAASTDAEGGYVLRGVDPELGVSITHPDYAERVGADGKEIEFRAAAKNDVFLAKSKFPDPTGLVRRADGTPLEGVVVGFWVNNHGKRETTTARDGTFTARNGSYDLEFSKEGFIGRKLGGFRGEIKPGVPLVVAMEPQVPLTGRVSGPDGKPVASFTVVAGTGPITGEYDSGRREFSDPAGAFALGLDHAGRNWVGVRAEGFAPWEGFAEVGKDARPLEVRLDPGVTIAAKVAAPPLGQSAIRAELIPRRDKTTDRKGGLSGDRSDEELATITAEVAGDGRLRIEHVRPDRYTLRLDGPAITPREWALDVPAGGLVLDDIALAGRGRIVGRVFRPEAKGGGPWEFVDGLLTTPGPSRPESWVSFTSGEDGRFAIENVPEGISGVNFQTQMGCVISSDTWFAQVVAGRTTEVHAFEPGRERPLPIALEVGEGPGNGRDIRRAVEHIEALKSSFCITLTPRSGGPIAFAWTGSETPDDRGQVVLRDVAPGRYRLRVTDWSGDTNLTDAAMDEQIVTVPPPSPIRIPIGAGCIAGRWAPGDESTRRVTIVATPKGRGGRPRSVRCDEAGNFCIHYLAPGRYTLSVSDPKAGWARVEDVTVPSGVVDVGELRPTSPGGTLAGTIAFARPCPIPDEVVATDSFGTSVSRRFEVYSSFDTFALGGLWPGRWTVRAKAGGETVATVRAEIAGTERVRLELRAGEPEGP